MQENPYLPPKTEQVKTPASGSKTWKNLYIYGNSTYILIVFLLTAVIASKRFGLPDRRTFDVIMFFYLPILIFFATIKLKGRPLLLAYFGYLLWCLYLLKVLFENIRDSYGDIAIGITIVGVNLAALTLGFFTASANYSFKPTPLRGGGSAP